MPFLYLLFKNSLRSNRSTIKVSCILVEARTGAETEVGYVVLHVKDATCFDIGEVDPSKAVRQSNHIFLLFLST